MGGLAAAAVLLTLLSPHVTRAQEYTFTTLAGPDGGPGWFDGVGDSARFGLTTNVAVGPDGTIYVSDRWYHTIRRVSTSFEVTTLAGLAGEAGSTDGSGSAARFRNPGDLTMDADGNLVVADRGNHTIRRITPEGVVTTIAGFPGLSGATDGFGPQARFNNPQSVAVDMQGNVYVAEPLNYVIRKISPDGEVSTLAGSVGARGYVDGAGSDARFYLPYDVVVGEAGILYVGDERTIRAVSSMGVVTTLAGNRQLSGNQDGTGTAATFWSVRNLTIAADGHLYATDGTNRYRRITTDGVVTTFLGPGVPYGGLGASPDGSLIVSEEVLRKVTMDGTITTLAGRDAPTGSDDGMTSDARFFLPRGLAVASNGFVFVAEAPNNHVVRAVSPAGLVSTLAGLAGTAGSIDGVGSEARFASPTGVTIDPDGNLYVTDQGAHTIRRIGAGAVVTTFAGKAGAAGSVDGTASEARFHNPTGIARDANGNLYVSDSYTHTIRKVSPAGVVTTLAGSAGLSGSVDGSGAEARFWEPNGVAVGPDGKVYVADLRNDTIRAITPDGVVSTFAGLAGSHGHVDGVVSEARFFNPEALAFDGDGNLYVSSGFWLGDFPYMHTVRKISPSGEVSTIAGAPGVFGTADGTGSNARFVGPTGLAVGTDGTIYVSDTSSNKIRVGRPTLAGSIAIDDPPGFVGVTHQLGFTGAATTHSWRVVRRPSGSTAELSSSTDSAPTFVPDVLDSFEIELVASNGSASHISRVLLEAPRAKGTDVTFPEETATRSVTITLSESQAETVTLDWSTADGTAVGGEDYEAASGSLSYAPGEITKTVNVRILNDELDEDDETLYVRLKNVSGVQNGGEAIVTILDDDPEPVISIEDAAVLEGDTTTSSNHLVFVFRLSRVSGRAVSCVVGTTKGTAGSTDFDPRFNEPVTFLPGETLKEFSVSVRGDTVGEEDETMLLWIASPINASLANTQAVGTIINDDFDPTRAPGAVLATAVSASSIAVQWQAFVGATEYRIYRSGDGSTDSLVGSTSATSWTDFTVTAGHAYLYRVAAVGESTEGMKSGPDLATNVIFTDPNLVAGVTTAKAAHVTELRTAVNAVRQLAGLAAAAFPDSNLTTIKRTHVVELRAALDAARSALGLPAIAYTDPAITAGVTRIKAAHVQELRAGVR